MPTGNLPEKGKALWEKVYEASKGDSCDEECAARKAWAAVKHAGWSKDENGEWHKKSELSEFSFRITRASYDLKNGRGNWFAVASDTDADSYDDNMTIQLFKDFLNRITSKESPPNHFCSDYWKGGMPYVSVSHYPDKNGDAVPGVVESIYIDGNRLKARGYFFDTKLGKACFDAVRRDLYGEPHPDGPVRISIAFLDYGHQHKSNGFQFTRSEASEFCSECVQEMLTQSKSGKLYLSGHLIHLAMTRVPVNKRTIMEVDKSMAIQSREQDAESIVGEELAQELSERSEVVNRSELVIKSEESLVEPETPLVVENAVTEDDEEDDDEVCKTCGQKKHKSDIEMSEVISRLDQLSETVRSLVPGVPVQTQVEPTASHPLDGLFASFKADFDTINAAETDMDAKLRDLQTPFEAFAEGIRSEVRSTVAIQTPVHDGGNDLVKALSEVMQPIASKLDLLLAQRTVPEVALEGATVRRSIPAPQNARMPIEKPAISVVKSSKGAKISDIVAATT